MQNDEQYEYYREQREDPEDRAELDRIAEEERLKKEADKKRLEEAREWQRPQDEKSGGMHYGHQDFGKMCQEKQEEDPDWKPWG